MLKHPPVYWLSGTRLLAKETTDSYFLTET